LFLDAPVGDANQQKSSVLCWIYVMLMCTYIYIRVCVIKYAVLISKVVSSCKHVSWVSGRHAALGKRSALLLWELHSSRLCYGTQTWRCQWLDWCYEKTQGIPGRFQEII
jgi:hypothetical protein